MALKDLGVIGEASTEELEELRRDTEDITWWNEHAHEFEAKYRGKYLTVINKEVLIGDSYDEVYEQAKSKYPNEEPFIDHIPYKKEILIL
ncbi:MAG: hypothetical protein FJ014_10860 [Chloroflexi bacterium]|nr:hypothetical protein [Chloroflexota bacterium]